MLTEVRTKPVKWQRGSYQARHAAVVGKNPFLACYFTALLSTCHHRTTNRYKKALPILFTFNNQDTILKRAVSKMPPRQGTLFTNTELFSRPSGKIPRKDRQKKPLRPLSTRSNLESRVTGGTPGRRGARLPQAAAHFPALGTALHP